MVLSINRNPLGCRLLSLIPDLLGLQKKSLLLFLSNSKGLFRSLFPLFSTSKHISISLLSLSYKKSISSSSSFILSPSLYLVALLKVNIYHSSTNLLRTKLVSVRLLDIPPFTRNGSFLVNGIERTVVSYLKKTPCLFFIRKGVYNSLKIIPDKGVWLEFIYSKDNIISFRINKGIKLNIFVLLYAFGICDSDLLNQFNITIRSMFFNNKLFFFLRPFQLRHIIGLYNIYDINLNILYRRKTLYKASIYLKLSKGWYYIAGIKDNMVLFSSFKLNNYAFIRNEVLNLNKLKLASNGSTIYIYIYNIFSSKFNNLILRTLMGFGNSNMEHNRILVMKSFLRLSYSNSLLLTRFNNTFLNKDYYNLSHFLRNEINLKTSNFKSSSNLLEKGDILCLIKYFIRCILAKKCTTDIDDISKKRLIMVGEILLDIISSKLSHFRNFILSRFSKVHTYSSGIIDIGFFSNYIREFFCTSQFSQFLDQNNSLSEITHKRRVTFHNSIISNNLRNLSIREIHISNYGKICPIETPEGHNIGLVNSLSVFSKVNKYCFITSPYFRVANGSIDISKIYYLSNNDEKRYLITSIDSFYSKGNGNYDIRSNNIFRFQVNCNIDFCTITCMQLFSIAPLFIPFMENDDANRALMGSNMQRQAIASICTEMPYIFTGLENIPPRDLNYTSNYSNRGNLAYYDSLYMLSLIRFKNVLIFKEIILKKFKPSNQCNVVNYKFVNHEVPNNYNSIITDSNDTNNGYISLGHNLLTAFIPFYGYNFEDSIVISDRVANSDMFCSIHSYDFCVSLNGSIYGDEFISKDIFEIDKYNYSKLDASGIISIGSIVSYNDILVSKIRPITKYENNPESKLINVIFNNKENSFKKAYFRLPLNIRGTVVEVNKYYNDNTLISNCNSPPISNYVKTKEILKNAYIRMISNYKLLYNVDFTIYLDKIHFLHSNISRTAMLFSVVVSNRITTLKKTISLKPNNSLKLKKVTIRIFSKKRLEVGDKMSGRHGNKGVVSKILPLEDMPFLSDGTPCDLVLNPLGIPSRMNIGQLLEISLGFIVFILNREFTKSSFLKVSKSISPIVNISSLNLLNSGFYFNSPPFEGFKYSDISNIFNVIISDKLKSKYLISNGKVRMYDGISGDPFDNYICFGYMYFFKLNHLSSDKIHARSTGPYSLITQQPLRGRSNLGGQRLGEMEVWALESYGASYTLHEMLTVKSDDIVNRRKICKDIFFNSFNFYSGTPESFNILINELKSLLIIIEKV
ncbi:DNA-directed RNA polymerase subunit beta [Candidatus Vidania fulgoroideorum]